MNTAWQVQVAGSTVSVNLDVAGAANRIGLWAIHLGLGGVEMGKRRHRLGLVVVTGQGAAIEESNGVVRCLIRPEHGGKGSRHGGCVWADFVLAAATASSNWVRRGLGSSMPAVVWLNGWFSGINGEGRRCGLCG
ncbi:hypothetical protein M0R45_016926 [Rubus argutus]|uniref:Uncharacterized protein n=1 Tax=Rubus argutus TaxID=59490 RepID=A0AAW1XWS3_RUBAR